MLSYVENAAACEIEHPLTGCGIGGSPAAVKRLRSREVDDAPAERARPDGKTHVLVVDEETLVEAAKGLEHGTANEEKSTHDLIDGARTVMRPVGDKVWRKNRGHEPVEADAV